VIICRVCLVQNYLQENAGSLTKYDEEFDKYFAKKVERDEAYHNLSEEQQANQKTVTRSRYLYKKISKKYD